MTLWKGITLGICSLGFAFSANALTFTDVDVDGDEGEPHWKYLSTWGTSSWDKTFNLLNAGFDPETMEIISASVSFAFADDNDRYLEYASILVGGESLWSWQEVDGSHNNSPYSYDWYSSSLGSSLISKLQDGWIDYSVQAEYGDFYLKEASLTVEAARTQVPDTGATLAMLGLGVATMLLLRRQMLKGDTG